MLSEMRLIVSRWALLDPASTSSGCEINPTPEKNHSAHVLNLCSLLYIPSKVISTAYSTRRISPPHRLGILRLGNLRTLATKNRRKFIKGAGLEAPRFFDNEAQHTKYFQKYIDGAAHSSLMFQVTTICHRTSDCKHPMVMLTNREGLRYFFGKIPEGSQRVLNENGIRFGKLRSIFLTGTITSWGDIGGLPGLFLTISDATSRGIDVFTNSAKLLTFIVTTWRYFVFRKGAELNILDTESQAIIGDSTTIFRPVKIASSKSPESPDRSISNKTYGQLKKIMSLMFLNEANEPSQSDPFETDIVTHVGLPNPSQLCDAAAQKSLSYVIRFLPVRGKFDPVRAKSLGVPPGVKFRNLTNGETVLNDQGEPVYPHQVMEESKVLPKVVIIDIPNNSYLQNTITSDEWLSKSNEHGSEDVGLVYHFLGDDVNFRLAEYTDFISKFPPQCKHVISHSSITKDTLVFRTYAVHLLKLKTLLNDNFNLPFCETFEPLEDEKHIKLHSFQTFSIDPSGVSLDNSNVVSETWSSIYDKEVGKPKQRELVLAKEVLPLLPVDDPKSMKDHVQIITLGTGSALPSVHRNVLSNLVRIPHVDQASGEIRFNSILLDGGENTLGSLMRNYGHNNKEQLKQIFGELRLIYLSHLHADHHLGIISVIEAWFAANANNSENLYLIVPWQYNHFVKEWFKLEGKVSNADMSRIKYISCEDFTSEPEAELKQLDTDYFETKYDAKKLHEMAPAEDSKGPNRSLINELYKDLRILCIDTVRAYHCQWSYSVSMKFQLSEDETFKVSFSGDTRPNMRFVDIGRDSDLLIHEASLENELIEEAISKRHSTVVEAVRVCQLMDCPKVILTHFSARFSEKHSFIESSAQYDKLQADLKNYLGWSVLNVFNVERTPKFGFDETEICYAYDLMTIRYNNLNCQKPLFDKINGLSVEDSNEERKQKELMKRTEKREAQRMRRLGKKRKKSVSL